MAKVDSTYIQKPCSLVFQRLGDLELASAAQRDLRKHRVEHLLAAFDPELLGYPVVNVRDGRTYVVDGWHRISALKIWFAESGTHWEDQMIECATYKGLTIPEEADLFLRINDTLSIELKDKYRISLTAGYPIEEEIERTVLKCGLTIAGKGGTSDSGIRSIGAIYKIHERAGYQVLGRTLIIVRDAYGDLGFLAPVLDGIALVVQRYDGELQAARTIKSLSSMRGGVHGLLSQAENLKMKLRKPKAQCVAATAVLRINKSKGTKLASWWSVSG